MGGGTRGGMPAAHIRQESHPAVTTENGDPIPSRSTCNKPAGKINIHVLHSDGSPVCYSPVVQSYVLMKSPLRWTTLPAVHIESVPELFPLPVLWIRPTSTTRGEKTSWWLIKRLVCFLTADSLLGIPTAFLHVHSRCLKKLFNWIESPQVLCCHLLSHFMLLWQSRWTKANFVKLVWTGIKLIINFLLLFLRNVKVSLFFGDTPKVSEGFPWELKYCVAL